MAAAAAAVTSAGFQPQTSHFFPSNSRVKARVKIGRDFGGRPLIERLPQSALRGYLPPALGALRCMFLKFQSSIGTERSGTVLQQNLGVLLVLCWAHHVFPSLSLLRHMRQART